MFLSCSLEPFLINRSSVALYTVYKQCIRYLLLLVLWGVTNRLQDFATSTFSINKTSLLATVVSCSEGHLTKQAGLIGWFVGYMDPKTTYYISMCLIWITIVLTNRLCGVVVRFQRWLYFDFQVRQSSYCFFNFLITTNVAYYKCPVADTLWH